MIPLAMLGLASVIAVVGVMRYDEKNPAWTSIVCGTVKGTYEVKEGVIEDIFIGLLIWTIKANATPYMPLTTYHMSLWVRHYMSRLVVLAKQAWSMLGWSISCLMSK